ncbi:MAG: hotdog fold thioesterase [Bacteroidota bacterium]|nr:hotdog fold thioesterase [Bacteroidota bacterium]
MSIWFHKAVSKEQLREMSVNTINEFLNIELTEIGDDYLKATMPVNERTRQPYGLLHGGASCVLAETIGSIASALVIDMEKFYCVGIEINANHLRSVKEGWVTGICSPLHLGKNTHVWDIKIYDPSEKLFCVSRLTTAIIPIKK